MPQIDYISSDTLRTILYLWALTKGVHVWENCHFQKQRELASN